MSATKPRLRYRRGRSPESRENLDPRDTDHPTGTKQAAENAANESPSYPFGCMNAIVITGASGNVGTALLRALPVEHDVLGVVRRIPAARGGIPARRVALAGPDGQEGIADLRRAFEGADVVVHLAWGFQPTRDTRYLTQLGVGGTAAVLAGRSRQRSRPSGAHVLGGHLRSWKLRRSRSMRHGRRQESSRRHIAEINLRPKRYSTNTDNGSEALPFPSPGYVPVSSCSEPPPAA